MDKLPSFCADATPRRSTSSLDGMSDLLLWFSRKSPLFVFATTWVLILAGFVLSSLPLAWPVRLVGSVLGVTIIFGYLRRSTLVRHRGHTGGFG